jgi:hypothetical protein
MHPGRFSTGCAEGLLAVHAADDLQRWSSSGRPGFVPVFPLPHLTKHEPRERDGQQALERAGCERRRWRLASPAVGSRRRSGGEKPAPCWRPRSRRRMSCSIARRANALVRLLEAPGSSPRVLLQQHRAPFLDPRGRVVERDCGALVSELQPDDHDCRTDEPGEGRRDKPEAACPAAPSPCLPAAQHAQAFSRSPGAVVKPGVAVSATQTSRSSSDSTGQPSTSASASAPARSSSGPPACTGSSPSATGPFFYLLGASRKPADADHRRGLPPNRPAKVLSQMILPGADQGSSRHHGRLISTSGRARSRRMRSVRRGRR